MLLQEFALHDIVIMKKPHPCGSERWQVVRTGADIKIKCLGCERVVMLGRRDFLKRLKKVLPEEQPAER
ncbi:MAG: DUF951 domain-containing protein [Christensenellales bacterium]